LLNIRLLHISFVVLCVLIVDRGTAKCFHNFCFLCFDQVLDIVGAKPGGSEPLNRNIVGGQDLLSSWVREDAVGVSRQSSNMYRVATLKLVFLILVLANA
jgi:hypothetical protein